MSYINKAKVKREQTKTKRKKADDICINWDRYGRWIDMVRDNPALERFFSSGNGIVVGISKAGLIPAIAIANIYHVQFMALVRNKKSEFELVEDIEFPKEHNKLMKKKEFNVLLVDTFVDRGNTFKQAIEFLNENGIYKKQIELLTLSLTAVDDSLTKYYPDLVMRPLKKRDWVRFPYEDNE